ncbi:MAG TPA: Mpo1-like protein [Burkholderiales bacterium]
MKNLADQMALYAAYHQDARNKATHFAGVPAIMLALFIPLSWPRVEAGPLSISAAMVLGGAVVLYYFMLDVPLALAMLAVTAAFIALAQTVAALGAAQGWIAFGALFAGGWTLQLIGHAFEGRKPALVDNVFQVFIAPIFLCAEIFFALGYRPELHAAVQERAQRLRAPLASG